MSEPGTEVATARDTATAELADIANVRRRVVRKMLDVANRSVDRATESYVVEIGEGRRMSIPEPPPKDVYMLMDAARIAVENARLEVGDPTSLVGVSVDIAGEVAHLVAAVGRAGAEAVHGRDDHPVLEVEGETVPAPSLVGLSSLADKGRSRVR